MHNTAFPAKRWVILAGCCHKMCHLSSKVTDQALNETETPPCQKMCHLSR